MDESVPTNAHNQPAPPPPAPTNPQMQPPPPVDQSQFSPPALPAQQHAPAQQQTPAPVAAAQPGTPFMPPARTVAAPVAAPGAMPMSTDLNFQPAPAPKRTKGLLIGGLAAVTVAGVAAAAFVLTSGSPDDEIGDDVIEVVTEREESSESFSFAAAATNAQQAASVSFDMSIDSPDGLMTMTAAVDRATGRMSMDIDTSQLVVDEFGVEGGDSMAMILDEQNGVAYIGGDFYDSIFAVDTTWLSMELDEAVSDTSTFDEIFTNPLDMTRVFGDLQPVDLGPETVDGESLHHYRVVVDAAAVANQPNLGDLTDEFGNIDEVAYDVWVSEDNQIRRIVFDVDDNGDLLGLDMWIDISPSPVDITLPDPSEVTSFEELLSQWTVEPDLEQVEPTDEITVDLQPIED